MLQKRKVFLQLLGHKITKTASLSIAMLLDGQYSIG